MAFLNGLWAPQSPETTFPELGDRFEEYWEKGLQWYRDLKQLQGGPTPLPIAEEIAPPAPSVLTPAITSQLGPLLFVIVGVVLVVWLKK